MTEINFKGKEFVYNHHLAVPFRPLVPHEDKGIGPVAFDSNMVIHGDNLHALKALLPLYAGKVDCVFIDPPYNTGNEGWCYNDNVNAPMIKEWLDSNPVGIEDGLRHDKWCAMMWPRLRLLHELLADEGLIFITIDNNEQHRLRSLLDEIFGDSGFVAEIAWQKSYSPSNDTIGIDALHDTIFVYSKIEKPKVSLLERTEKQDAAYKNPDDDPRGPWKPGDATRAEHRDYAYYPIKTPSGKEVWPADGRSWMFTKEELPSLLERNLLYFGEDGAAKPSTKQFLNKVKSGLTPTTWWSHRETGHNDQAKKEIKRIIPVGLPFQTPKPLRLLQRIVNLVPKIDAIFLDSFSGSATTAHAVLEANKRDGGNRRFILVEMEDYADQLTAERVRRVINGYDFEGTQRTELLRENITWTKLSNADRLTQKVQALENLHGHEYDRISKTVKEGELIVIGEKAIAERADGLGGAFTYCTLGDPVELDKVLNGEMLPSYAGIGAALFHMATNHAFDPATIREHDFYLGATEGQHVWLIYRPDLEWLKSPEAALTLTRAKTFAATDPDKRHLVFAPARYVSQKMLTEQNIPVEFVPLPFSLYRIDRS